MNHSSHSKIQILDEIINYSAPLNTASGDLHYGTMSPSISGIGQASSRCLYGPVNGENGSVSSSDDKNSSSLFRRATSVTKKTLKNVGDRDDDIHVAVSCLRAIMNNKVRLSSNAHYML